MMKRGALLLGVCAVIVSSCIDHEVIPPPQPTVDLYANFYGIVNGAEVELTEHVLGYANTSTKSKLIVPQGFSSAVYYSTMSSQQVPTYVKIGMGSVLWDATLAQDPPLNTFNGFHQSYITPTNPDYSEFGTNGFEVTYQNGFGVVYKSRDPIDALYPQEVEFTGIEQESDESGDYSQFTCTFDCWVYSTGAPVPGGDSIHIQDAVYRGWFKR